MKRKSTLGRGRRAIRADFRLGTIHIVLPIVASALGDILSSIFGLMPSLAIGTATVCEVGRGKVAEVSALSVASVAGAEGIALGGVVCERTTTKCLGETHAVKFGE